MLHDNANTVDIVDCLGDDELLELQLLLNETAEKDTISEEEFRILFARWT